MGILNNAKIKQLREARDLTQADAAEAAGMRGGRQAWNDVESGRRTNVTMDTLEGIARALKVKPAELLK